MKVIWDTPEHLALQGVLERVNAEKEKQWKPQTVSTFLARLVRKGFLTAYRKGRYTYYVPAVTMDAFWKETMQENARFFNKGDMGEMVCALCENMLSQEDIKKVKQKMDALN